MKTIAIIIISISLCIIFSNSFKFSSYSKKFTAALINDTSIPLSFNKASSDWIPTEAVANQFSEY